VEHRVQAIRELIRITKVGGRIAIFVWALNQSQSNSKAALATAASSYSNSSNAEDTEEDASTVSTKSFGQQDIFVPWTISTTIAATESLASPQQQQQGTAKSSITLQRYLHVYRNRELAELVDIVNRPKAVVEILEEGVDHGNCFVILRRIAL